MKSIRPLDFYTKADEPLQTQKGIRFYFEYKNDGDEDVKTIPAEIVMGDIVRSVKLPGLSPGEKKTVEMILTNNISEDINAVGVRLGNGQDGEIMKAFSWMGKIDLRIDALNRYEVMDNSKDIYFRALLHNKGTKTAKKINISIERDNKFYGDLTLDELAPKTAMPVNVAFDRRSKGFFKIKILAKSMNRVGETVSRTFHVELGDETINEANPLEDKKVISQKNDNREADK